MEPDEGQTARTAEQALREWEGRFRAFLEIASAWFWETDASLRITRVDGRRPCAPSSR